MYNIDPNLYATNAFYRELVDQMRISEKKQLQLRMEQDRLKAERDIFYRQRMIEYANQIPYSCMTPVSPYQWRAPYTMIQNNFVSYWERVGYEREQARIAQQRSEQAENLRHAFRTAADMAAVSSKQDAPVASIVFDGIGLLTTGNLLEAAKSVVSIIDTAMQLSNNNSVRYTDDNTTK